jgi:hypothetical protein
VHLLEEFEKKNPGLSHIRISVLKKIWRLFIWQKFELKNVISTNTKDFFHGKNRPNSPNFEKKKKFESPNFYNKFQ